MTPDNKILRDLLAGQATASALASRLQLPEPAVKVLLSRHLTAGRVESVPLSCLTVWRLAPATRQALLSPA